MKRKIVSLLIVVLAATAFWFRGLWLPAPQGDAQYLGYVEGETVLLGPLQAGRIVARPVDKGGRVEAGGVVFRLDAAAKEIEVARAEAAVRAAEASRDDLLSGKRDAEIAPVRAQRDQAAAALALAEQELSRATRLSRTGVAAEQQLDQARATVDQYKAQVAQFDATARAYELAARPDAIAAAGAAVDEARAALGSARQAVADLTIRAPAAATVENTYFDVGEYVAAGQPVVSLLPPAGVTLRVFIPEPEVAKAGPGTRLTFTCDGCGPPRSATVTHVAGQAEYTPPVIYSQTSRAKLVFRVEAKPDDIKGLQPGLPISVEPLP